jgi:hypothetical protein
MLDILHEFYNVKISIGSMFILSTISLCGGLFLGYLIGRE